MSMGPPTRRLLIVTCVVSLLPALAGLLGWTLGGGPPALDYTALAQLPAADAMKAVFVTFQGPFVHTLMEWSAVAAAVATFALTLLHYRVTGNVVTAIIGVALLTSGVMDGFHTLAADRLVQRGDATDFIPFTWALCRMFNAVILTVGSLLLILRPLRHDRGQARTLASALIGFPVVAVLCMGLAAALPDLPKTMYPGAILSRPWDVVPGLVYVLAGLFVMPALYRRFPGFFSAALWISMIPNAMSQAHMALGSSQLFDHHFQIGHALKVVAYLVPFVGLMLDYSRAYFEADRAEDLARTVADLERTTKALSMANEELDRFATMASHDLQEPLRKVQAFAERLEKHYSGVLDERGLDYLKRLTGASGRMRDLIGDLLLFSRTTRGEAPEDLVPMEPVLAKALAALEIGIAEAGAQVTIGALPTVRGDAKQLVQLFQNLVGNGVKYRRPGETPHIDVSGGSIVGDDGTTVVSHEIRVTDDGIGFEQKFAERIFEPFRRLHGTADYTGTGIGLAICARIVERHRGTIHAVSAPGQGATFVVRFPIKSEEKA